MKNFKIAIALVASTLSCSCSLRVYDYKTDMARQRWIMDAYYKFMDSNGRRPDSIAELVSDGALPEYSLEYSCLLNLAPFSKATKYDKSDYKIFPKARGSSKILGVRVEWGTGWNFSAETRAYINRKEKARSNRAVSKAEG